jgi:ubiquinone/menaquinone biosynthesis C-methylase UbiE/uncharacterized protein YbaR (Trm112 family)
MKTELLTLLCCPLTGQSLTLEIETNVSSDNMGGEPDEIKSGWLVSENGKHRYPIRDSIPRFVTKSNYADNFGMQWNLFAKTQLDSNSGCSISAERFWEATGWKAKELRGQWVLDVGCGSGRFAEIALSAGAKVVALDYSNAVDAAYANLKDHANFHVIQGDIYSLPFIHSSFRFVYSLGVLQHTPDVPGAFAALPPLIEPGGNLCVDFYWNRLRTMLNPKYLLRPFTKRMDQQKLFSKLTKYVPKLLRISQFIGRIPLIGQYLKRIIPVVDYTGIYPLSQKQLEEWALLDTFDMLAPAYDNPQSAAMVTRMLAQGGIVKAEVLHSGHLVGRGKKRTEISGNDQVDGIDRMH